MESGAPLALEPACRRNTLAPRVQFCKGCLVHQVRVGGAATSTSSWARSTPFHGPQPLESGPLLALEPASRKYTCTPACAALQGLPRLSGACGWCCAKHKRLGKIDPCPWTAALRKWAPACPRASLAETHSNPLCSFARVASFIRCVRVVLRQAQAVGQDQPLSLDLSPRKVGHRLP